MTPRARAVTVIGLGVTVAVSTAIQALVTTNVEEKLRPFVLLGAVMTGVVAAWQLVAGAALNTPAPAPASPPSPTASSPTPTPAAPKRRLGAPMLTAALALLIALTSVLLQFRPAGGAEPDDDTSAAPTPPPTASAPATVPPSATANRPTASTTRGDTSGTAPATMVWKGVDDQTTLWWSTLSGGRWSEQRAFSDRSTRTSPALASVGGKVYMAWREPDDSHIFWSSYNGSAWTSPRRLDDRRTETAPALGVSGSRLVMTWRGVDGDTGIYWSTLDGSRWSDQRSVGGRATAGSPALGSAGGKLYMAWLEAADGGSTGRCSAARRGRRRVSCQTAGPPPAPPWAATDQGWSWSGRGRWRTTCSGRCSTARHGRRRKCSRTVPPPAWCRR
ncbi:hypothetical protein AB0B66_24955 [Catellatospora sp. NPDC049111]|uniref:hypothetical protein n=1 Tax=Catellatospora sp. NPDC049111 TaxID=3155271 RepID=UPI0033F3BA0F